MSPKSSVKLTCPINEPACLETRNWGSSILPAGLLDFEGVGDTRMLTQCANTEVGAFYWTVLAPDIVNPEREEQGSVSV